MFVNGFASEHFKWILASSDGFLKFVQVCRWLSVLEVFAYGLNVLCLKYMKPLARKRTRMMPVS